MVASNNDDALINLKKNLVEMAAVRDDGAHALPLRTSKSDLVRANDKTTAISLFFTNEGWVTNIAGYFRLFCTLKLPNIVCIF